jgi:hypothetical protein
MTDREDFKLSDPLRIKTVCLSLQAWMKKNDVKLFEINRAIAMLLRFEDENRASQAREGHK